MQKFCLGLFLLFTLFLPWQKAEAYSNFQKSIDAVYTVYNTGITHVVLNISLTNTSSKFFAQVYAIDPGVSDIERLVVKSSSGKVIINKNRENILLNFSSMVVGFGKKLSLEISFDTKDIAQKEGRIWEISIPGIASINDYSDFTASVTVPSSFGSPAYLKPTSAYQDLEYKNNTFIFSKNQLEHSGISMGFGDKQIYSFTISYHIKNTNLFPITESIALPPDTNYQTVSINSISEKPQNVARDKDGNWLAGYYLYPSQEKNIVVKGDTEVFLNPKQETEANLADYLKDDPNWQSSNPPIYSLAKKLKTPRAIYEYVVRNLHYDFSRVRENKTRLGALRALENPKSAVCLEFTDLFVALSRAAGIPAREVDGFAYTTNSKQRPLSLVKDVLHAWPQYYDFSKKTWIMVDPTWGNTTNGVDYFNTMDFDHVAFVIKGENSLYPIPAGGYKTEDWKNEKDVNITFSDKFKFTPLRFSFETYVPKKSLSEFLINGFITIKNSSSLSLKPQTINIETNYLIPQKQKLTSNEIPPYGSSTIPFSLRSPSLLTNQNSTVRISAAGKTFIYNIAVVPFNLEILFIGGFFCAILIGILSFIAARAWNISIFG